MLPIFEAWDLAVAPVTVRSRLYSLIPIGIGTAFVESLSGYLVRLAESHAVSVGSLVHKELSYSVVGETRLALASYAINGVGTSAQQAAQALGNLTLRPELRYLTLLPFEKLFPKPFLFRKIRAWCSACYEQMSSRGEPIYEPLLWCLKLVDVCPRHRLLLATTCPRCRQSQRPLYATSRPGFCSRCGFWLGSTTEQSEHPLPACVPTEYQLWLADALGELLANAPEVEPERLRDRARSALLAYAKTFTEGNRSAVTYMAGFRHNGLLAWFNGSQEPRIDTLLRTWYKLRLPIICLLKDTFPEVSSAIQAQGALEIGRARKVAPNRSREQIRLALQEALHEQPAPSVNEIARRLGYSTTERLRDADRILCRQIALNYRRSGRSHWWRRRGAKPICELPEMKAVLEDYLASDKSIPPLDCIARSLGFATDQSLRKKLPELCCALSARIAAQKRARIAAIETVLEQALREIPPQSLLQLAQQIGFSTSCVLKAHAPILYEEFKKYRQVYETRQRVELRDKLAAVLLECPPPSLRSIYSRFGVTESIMNTNFPDLRRKIRLRYLQHQRRQSEARRDALRTEVREIVGMLHNQGVCPSVPRVTNLLKSGSLREWGIICSAVNDARKELKN
jgi:AraC-like DNA-binding protein